MHERQRAFWGILKPTVVAGVLWAPCCCCPPCRRCRLHSPVAEQLHRNSAACGRLQPPRVALTCDASGQPADRRPCVRAQAPPRNCVLTFTAKCTWSLDCTLTPCCRSRRGHPRAPGVRSRLRWRSSSPSSRPPPRRTPWIPPKSRHKYMVRTPAHAPLGSRARCGRPDRGPPVSGPPSACCHAAVRRPAVLFDCVILCAGCSGGEAVEQPHKPQVAPKQCQRAERLAQRQTLRQVPRV